MVLKTLGREVVHTYGLYCKFFNVTGGKCFGGGREGEVGGWVVRNDWARLLKNEGQLVALNESGNRQSCVRVRSSSIAITGISAKIHN